MTVVIGEVGIAQGVVLALQVKLKILAAAAIVALCSKHALEVANGVEVPA